MKSRDIYVVGCGWLGLPLLRSLVGAGHRVWGTSRKPDTLDRIARAGGRPLLVDLPDQLAPDFRPEPGSILLVTLPPRGRALGAEATAHYLACLRALPLAAEGPAVIFTSSTGVYGTAEGRVTENTSVAPDTHSARAVVAAEDYLRATVNDCAVLRLAGLVAADRHPGRFYGGRERPVPAADAPVNLVHRKDVIAAVHLLVDRGITGHTVHNVCAAAHPTKGTFYAEAAAALGLKVAGGQAGGRSAKTIDSTSLRSLGWQPTWDDLNLQALAN